MISSVFLGLMSLSLSCAYPYFSYPQSDYSSHGSFGGGSYGGGSFGGSHQGYHQPLMQSSSYQPMVQSYGHQSSHHGGGGGGEFDHVFMSDDIHVTGDQAYEGTAPVPSIIPAPHSMDRSYSGDISRSFTDTLTADGSNRVPRGSHHHHGDLVDYGAYTGGHGAYGWYSDHPVSHHH